MLIIMCSNIFGYAITYGRIPQASATAIIGVSDIPYVVLFTILGFCLLLECLWNPLSILYY